MSKLTELMNKHFFPVAYVAMASFVLLATYNRIANEFESDPLTIEASERTELFTLSSGEVFEFWREICVHKNMVITVHREFYNLDTADRYMMPSINYGAKEDDGCFDVRFLSDVPRNMDAGMYLYRPVLIYAVNENKTIAKPAPPVKVEIIE